MESRWKCIKCGAQFTAHHPACSSCWAQGQIVPCPQRSVADVDYLPGAATAREIARMQWAQVTHSAYPELVLGAKCFLLASGLPGSGKSSFAARLTDSVPGPVVYLSEEEGISPSLACRLDRCAVRRDDFHVLAHASVDHVVEFSRAKKAASLVIDSVAECVWRADELRHVLEVLPCLDLLIAVAQTNKDGEPLGRQALIHEADVVVICQGMIWGLRKSRYQDLGLAGGEILPSPPSLDPTTTLEVR